MTDHGGGPRLALVLGIANWSIFIDHIPNNAISLLTPQSFGFSGATDLFVFVAGYASAIIYGRMTVQRGFIVATTRIFARVWQLYVAYVVSFLLYIYLIGAAAAHFAAPGIIDEYKVIGIVDDPTRTWLHGLLLQSMPLNLDGLQLFIVLMMILPLALTAMLRFPGLTLLGSAALYLAARQFDLYLSAFPEGRWSFNPFCWQLLFVLGVWFALHGGKRVQALREISLPRQAALAYLLFALVISVAARIPQLNDLMPDALLRLSAPGNQETLPPHRLLHFLALALVFTWLVPRDWQGFRWRALQPVLKCGEEWLAAFCAGLFLSFAGHFVLITGPNSLTMQAAVSAAGVATMAAIAYYVSWSRLQDYVTAPNVTA
jgi:hypothetical protein